MPIRPRAADDLDAVVAIAERVHLHDGYPVYRPPTGLQDFLARPAPLAAWVATDDDTIVGHVALNPSSSQAVMTLARESGIGGDIGVVARLLVDPDRRREGWARQLLDRARDAALGDERVPVLDVVASSAPAIALYRRAGWVELGTVTLTLPDGRELDELVFAWR